MVFNILFEYTEVLCWFFVCVLWFFLCVVCLLLVLISVGYNLCSLYVVYCMIDFVTDESKRFF